MPDYPFSGKTLAWLLQNLPSHSQDSNYMRAIQIKIGALFTGTETPAQISGKMDVLSEAITRNIPEGDENDPDDAWLAAPNIIKVWLFRSGGNVGGYKDIIVGRNGTKGFWVYNVTDKKDLFYVNEDGSAYVPEGILGMQTIVSLFINPSGEAITDPGTTYTPVLDRFRAYVEFTTIKIRRARLIITAIGNEATTGKGIRVTVGGTLLAEVTWDGAGEQQNLRGSWNSVNLETKMDEKMQIEVKGSSATEDLTIYNIQIQLDSYGGS